VAWRCMRARAQGARLFCVCCPRSVADPPRRTAGGGRRASVEAAPSSSTMASTRQASSSPGKARPPRPIGRSGAARAHPIGRAVGMARARAQARALAPPPKKERKELSCPPPSPVAVGCFRSRPHAPMSARRDRAEGTYYSYLGPHLACDVVTEPNGRVEAEGGAAGRMMAAEGGSLAPCRRRSVVRARARLAGELARSQQRDKDEGGARGGGVEQEVARERWWRWARFGPRCAGSAGGR
jgi:hypothetical protein